MRSSWTLEGYLTPEKMRKLLGIYEKSLEVAEGPDFDFFQERLEETQKNLAEHPDGFWKVCVENGNYKDFCREARRALRNLPGIEYRVLKEGCARDGVMRFIRATLG